MPLARAQMHVCTPQPLQTTAHTRSTKDVQKLDPFTVHHKVTEHGIAHSMKSCVHNKHFRGLVYMHAFTTGNAHHHKNCPE